MASKLLDCTKQSNFLADGKPLFHIIYPFKPNCFYPASFIINDYFKALFGLKPLFANVSYGPCNSYLFSQSPKLLNLLHIASIQISSWKKEKRILSMMNPLF